MTWGLWKSVWLPSPQEKGCGEKVDRSPQVKFPCMPSLTHPLAYLGSDAEVVVRDELWALAVASVHPAVKGAEGYAGESQHKGQEAPGAGWGRKGESERRFTGKSYHWA